MRNIKEDNVNCEAKFFLAYMLGYQRYEERMNPKQGEMMNC